MLRKSKTAASSSSSASHSSNTEGFSPISFLQCTRGVGRPKLKRFGAPSLIKSKRTLQHDQTSQQPLKRGRGRPKGAKNKPKDLEMQQAKRIRTESEKCIICLFNFDDPVKAGKELTHCTVCNTKVHKPCLLKDGCLSDTCFLLM